MAFIRNVDKLIEGLENKFFTEARAKAALAPELAAEESARLAGDSAEAAAREAADNALDQRLQVVEGSGEGSVAKAEQDAKDYADQKVAALVNSAPAVLDTLKELSDALGGDENFATTVAGQIGAVDSKVDQEILDRQSAVSAEQSARESADQALDGRLDILEQDPTTKSYVDGEVSDLQGQITQEISDRQSAVSSEQSARELADSNLSGRISVLEQDPTTKSYVDGEVSDLQGQINQEISDRQSAVSSEQSRAQSAEQALDGRLDILEQDPTTKSYVDGEVLDLQGQITQEISDRQSDVNAEESRAMSAEAALDGRIDILEQDPTTKAYVDQEVSAEESRSMLAEQGLQSDIDAEEVRAMAAESALDGRIDVLEQDPTTKTYVDGEVMDLQGQISQEISDRQSAVSGEASARQMADNALDARLDVLEQDPTTKSYVDGIQSALDSRLDILESDPVTKSYVDGEVSGLQGQVNTEKGRIDAILSAADADKDSFAEIVQLINSVDASNDSAFAGYVLSNDAALAQEVSDREAAVSAEQLSREAEDSAINAKFGSMVSYLTGEVAPDMTQVVDDTRTYLQNEMIAANEQLQGTIQQNQENLQSSIGGVQEQLNQEISDREAAEGLLDGRLDVLETDPTTKAYVDSGLALKVDVTPNYDIKPGIYNNGTKSSNFAINFANGPMQKVTLAGSMAVTFQNPVAGGTYLLELVQDGTGGRQVTFPTIQWFNNSAPVLSGANKIDFIQLFYDGSNYYGSYQLADVTFAKSSELDSSVSSLQTSISTETSARIAADNSEASTRASADTTLQNNINSEASARAAEDLTMFKKDGSRVMTGAIDMGNFAINNIGDISMLGGQKVKYSQKAIDYTLVSGDYLIGVSDVSASRIMTLPSASSVGAGKVFIIKDQSGAASQAKYIQIAPQAGQTIDGQSDYKIVMPYESVMLVSNGTHWFIV